MKRLLCAFALTVLVSALAPQAKSQDVSIDFFYNNLNGGSWIEVGNYGYCWQPDIVRDPSWRPYADGYWAYTDLGWTWVSYEDFGWATYHYGRWVRLADFGWVWVPGYRWGPAWVSWRFGGGYAGWAPLPPETEVVYESRPLSGHLDVEFDIGPAYYNFVDVRYIGEPVLRSRIVPYEQNVTYVTQTVNVTNITYKNKNVYNYGPDLNVVNRYSARPVQTLKLERQVNVDVATAARSGGLTKVQGNSLVVAAPPEIKKGGKEIAPPAVKTKVEQPKVEKGWSVAGDENAKQQLKEKLKAENPRNVPPPTTGGNAGATAAGGMTSARPTIPEKGKGKNKGVEQFQSGAGSSPITAPEGKRKGMQNGSAGGPPNPIQQDFNEPRGKLKQMDQSPSGMSPNGQSAAGPQGGGEGRGKHEAETLKPPPQGAEQTGAAKHEGKGKGQGAATTATPGP